MRFYSLLRKENREQCEAFVPAFTAMEPPDVDQPCLSDKSIHVARSSSIKILLLVMFAASVAEIFSFDEGMQNFFSLEH